MSPKLNKTMAKKVNESSSDFEPVEDGAYHLRLRSVDGTGEGPKGPYWSWEFESVEDNDSYNRRFWLNTSLSDSAWWKFKEAFDAFGADTDTDTDELCGQIVKGIISTRTIQQGDRKGEMTNQIDKLLPADPDFKPAEREEPAGVGADGGSEEDIPF